MLATVTLGLKTMVQATGEEALPAKIESWEMFDRIAPSYDLLNRVISFRRDVAWRRRLARHLPSNKNQRVLDLATGTADVLIGLSKDCINVESGVGLDMSVNMLRLGKDKVAELNLTHKLNLMRGDACSLAVGDESFDAVTMAFGIRNVPDVGAALREIHRVLKPGGRALILEFSLPANRWIRRFYLMYFRHVLPRIGGLVSGDGSAYRYLNQTVEDFPHGQAFANLMREAGFREIDLYPLTFGVATLYQGDK